MDEISGGVEALFCRCDLVIETVPERLDIKFDVLGQIAQRDPAIIASNTSALSIDELSKSVADPQRFLGLHFFNPVWSIKDTCRILKIKTLQVKPISSIASEYLLADAKNKGPVRWFAHLAHLPGAT